MCQRTCAIRDSRSQTLIVFENINSFLLNFEKFSATRPAAAVDVAALRFPWVGILAAARQHAVIIVVVSPTKVRYALSSITVS